MSVALVGAAVGVAAVVFAVGKMRHRLYLLAVLRHWPDENDLAMRHREMRRRRARWHGVPPCSSRALFAGVPQARDTVRVPLQADGPEQRLGERIAEAIEAAEDDQLPLGDAINDAAGELVTTVARPGAGGDVRWHRHQRRHTRRRR